MPIECDINYGHITTVYRPNKVDDNIYPHHILHNQHKVQTQYFACHIIYVIQCGYTPSYITQSISTTVQTGQSV